MRLFMTLEIDGSCEELVYILNEINKKLDFVTNKSANLEEIDNYGMEFKSIAIIPSCMTDRFYMGWKERKQIWRKKREADIRLRMDNERFVRENENNKRLMFIDVIIKSIEEIGRRSKEDFRSEELINDILIATNVTREEIEALKL